MTKKTEEKKYPLPEGMLVSDRKRPEWTDKEGASDNLSYNQLDEFYLDCGYLQMYYTQTFGWCITTLLISNPGRRSSSTTSRYYAVTLKGEVVRVGHGPHVLAEEKIYVKKSNLARLQKYIDLRVKGLADAGGIRDRISSRRAQGQQRRSMTRDFFSY